MRSSLFIIGSALAVFLIAGSASAEDGSDQAELAQQLANPVATLTVLPFQFNYDRGFGSADGDQYQLNIQPIIPFSLNADWNLITRTILPVEAQNDIAGASGGQFGLGDTLLSLFLSPEDSGVAGLVWAAGPVFLLPTATDDLLGSGKWGAGPTAAIVYAHGPWTTAVLANQIWSFAGDDNRADVSAGFIQPVLTYTTDKAWSFTLTSESTYDWLKGEWAVPIDFTIGKLVTFGKQPVNFSIGPRYWATSPESGPQGWGVRAMASFVFPK